MSVVYGVIDAIIATRNATEAMQRSSPPPVDHILPDADDDPIIWEIEPLAEADPWWRKFLKKIRKRSWE